jgi:hypothetical protein
MKKTWLLKLSVLATVLATLTGCPALSSLMDIFKGGQSGPQKALTITGIPSEYEGKLMQIFAMDPLDTDGRHPCMGGMPEPIEQGKAKSFIFDVGTITGSEKEMAVVAIKTVVMKTGKPCDSKERVVAFSLLSFDGSAGKSSDMNAIMEESLNNMFFYTKGVNICDTNTNKMDEASVNAATRYSLSGTESVLKFSDFMRASDCGMLMDIFRGSEEYVVVKEGGLDIMKTPNGEKTGENIAQGKVINAILPKETKKIDNFLWTKVSYKDKDGSKKNWMDNRAYSAWYG